VNKFNADTKKPAIMAGFSALESVITTILIPVLRDLN